MLKYNFYKKVMGLLPRFVSGQQGFGSLIFIDKLITASKMNKSAVCDKVLDIITLGRFVKLINFLGVVLYCGGSVVQWWDQVQKSKTTLKCYKSK